ncbi:hypothetical protein [Croceicoccus sp. Ery15]|uniref:hypothetical protein n=1 Tax=Croceicoccus sp. Ery15 TaxID=1703338 RepID=UPI001E3C3C30|nr:hypothetical protein [Croceicoccus sp. Ery15]
MENSAIVESAIRSLANTMRLYGEAQMRFGNLVQVDPEEAVDNVDRAFEAKLEAFHTLYDVSKEHFPYFEHGDTGLLIAIRNAIHHRNHPLFHSLNWRLRLDDGGAARLLGASFLLAFHPTLHGSPVRMSHHVKLDDVDARLDPNRQSPYLDVSLRRIKAAERFSLIDRQLRLPAIREFGSREGYPGDQVYLDLMPIFVSAVSKVFTRLSATGFKFRGFDAETYLVPFTTELQVDLADVKFAELRLRGWGPLDLIPIPIE